MGGVACRKPTAAVLVSQLLVLLLIGLPATLAACEREMATSSPMFGAKWEEKFVLYTQDYNWKVSGDITKVNLFFGESEGCVKGIKAQYGGDPANAQRLGVESKNLLARSMQLKAGERIVRAEYKASSRCIEYLSLRTNQGRQLAVGRHDSPTPTAFAAPTNPSGYLGYINGHTAKPMANPHVGKLMQLQFVWADSTCGSSGQDAASISSAGGSGGSGSGSGKKKKNGSKVSLMSLGNGDASAADDAAGSDGSSSEAKCAGNHLCQGGKCATSSCMLAGIGSEVPNMMCYGTNMRLPFLSSGIDVSPCSFLGCKLDAGSCTSNGLMGVGGFCTGRVVAMGAAAMLHPQGKQWLGYPCVEHKSAPLGLRASMLGEITSAEDMVAKAWKVCDCVKKAPLRNSLAIMMPNGTITSFVFGGKGGSSGQQQQQPGQATVAVPLMPVYDMGIKDVVTQWMAAKAGNAALPTATISDQLASDLKQLVPGFMTPSLLIANTSAALMTRPEWMVEVPVFVLPNSALVALKAFLPDLTSLPTLALGPNMSPAEAATLLELPKGLLVSDLTVEVLPALAGKLGLPTFLKLNPSTSTSKVDSKSDAGPHLVPLDQMHIGNVVVQWATAVSRKAPLPTLVLGGKEQLQQLQAKVPGLVTPSIIVPNISHALLFKPASPGLPLFVLPGELTADVMALLPDITSLPSFLVLPEQAKEKLPELSLTDFIAPNMRVMVETLGPSIPLLLKQVSAMGGPTMNVSMAGLAESPALQALMSSPWGHVLSTALPEIPDLLVDASSLDMGSIGQVVGAVREALTTSGFKLPYLSMTEDTLQKWGLKKIEGFVTNVVTRATTPREDPSLIDDSEDSSSAADTKPDAGDNSSSSKGSSKPGKKRGSSSGGKKKRAAAADGDGSSSTSTNTVAEPVQAAQRQNTVAAAINALRDEELVLDASAKHKSDAAATTTPTAGPAADQTTKEEDLRPEQGTVDEEIDQAAQSTTTKPPAAQPKTVSSAEPTEAKPSSPQGSGFGYSSKKTAAAAAAGKAAGGKDREPPAKPAYNPNAAKATGTAPAADTAAATAAAGAPVPIQGKVVVSGSPVPTTTNLSAKQTAPAAQAAKPAAPKAAPAPAQPAAAAKAAPAAQQQQPQLDKTQLELLGKQQQAAAAAKPAVPIGTEDEDGAIVIDVAEARRAFMSAEQWAALEKVHQDKLLQLLDVEA